MGRAERGSGPKRGTTAPTRQTAGSGSRAGRSGRPYLSVIVPVHRAPGALHASLGALAASDLPRSRWELVVVNDGSDEETASVAARYADAVVKLPGKPRGPSYARNRGAEHADGEVLVFVDSDVCVHPDALRRFHDLFRAEPEIAAAFGSYDDRPPAGGVVSCYRNLLHHHVHQSGAGDAETFWAGCGAIRAPVFRGVGGYDEWHFGRPQIEDIELGRRVRRAGHRIVLRPRIQGTHLKKWGFWETVMTDLKHRGMVWTRLLLHEGRSGASSALNLSAKHRACAILVSLAVLGALAGLVLWSPWPLIPAGVALAGVTALNWRFYRLIARRAGWWTPLAAVPLHWLHYLSSVLAAIGGWLAYTFVGAPQPPPDVAAFEEIGLETWPPVPTRPEESVWYRHGREDPPARRRRAANSVDADSAAPRAASGTGDG